MLRYVAQFKRATRLTNVFEYTRTYATSVRNVLDVLDSQDPFDAYPMILSLREKQLPIPPLIMTKFYNALTRNYPSNQFAVHVFERLVTVAQVGSKYFPLNAGRLVNLYLQTRNLEMCIAFVREVEWANNGSFVFPYNTLESILISAKWHKDADIALQIVQIMHAAYPNVYGRTWGLLAQCLIEAKDYEGLRWVHRKALVPGFLVLDDASYVKIAQIASRNGDLSLCEWVVLRMRRRQRALMSPVDPKLAIRLYIHLIEAAAKKSTIKTVCRYVVRLGSMARAVSLHDLPQTVQALAKEDTQTREILNAIVCDPGVSDEVRTLIYNLTLATKLFVNETSVNDVVEAISKGQIENGVNINEDSIICLLELAAKFNVDKYTLQNIASKKLTPRVQKLCDSVINEA